MWRTRQSLPVSPDTNAIANDLVLAGYVPLVMSAIFLGLRWGKTGGAERPRRLWSGQPEIT